MKRPHWLWTCREDRDAFWRCFWNGAGKTLAIGGIVVLLILAASCTGSKSQVIRTTTTAKSLSGNEVTTVTEAPYESPEDKAHAAAVEALFSTP